MTRKSGTIALVGFDPSGAKGLASALKDGGALEVEELASPLTQINGQAVRLSKQHDLVVFRMGNETAEDIAALQNLRENREKRATIVALIEGTASVATAHRLAQAGADQVLPDTMSVEEIRQQILETLRPKAGKGGAARHRGRVITVAQARGGVGATTVAVNLADALLDRHGMLKKTNSHRVALIDLDLQFGSVARFLDVPASDGLFQIARDQSLPDMTFLHQSMTELPGGLSVLAAPTSFAPIDSLSREQVKTIIELLTLEFDYVVIDLPRLLVDWVSPALELSDRMLMVTDTSVPSIQQARRLIDFYTEDSVGLKVDIVVNNEKRPVVKGRHHAEAAKVLERPLDIWLPPDSRTSREAIDRGVPLSMVSSRSPLNKSMRKLGKRMLAELAASSQPSKHAD